MTDPSAVAGNYFGDEVAAPTSVNRSGYDFVRQVPIVAMLMVVQGLLEILLAMFYGGSSFFLLQLKAMPQGGDPKMVVGLLAGLAALAAVIGFMRIGSAIFLYQYKQRKLAVITLLAGLAVVGTGYCVPTAFCLTVYGLVVLFDERVIAACDKPRAS
ncbi:hypothetical protein NA78x_004677 [Anatilimnocola sp. NA78]|uniref:hypothetical protein n=1 Tax=Anatilimnocola sp. NA78 TaxID=3415683 RepID=UPI003CE5B4CC